MTATELNRALAAVTINPDAGQKLRDALRRIQADAERFLEERGND